MPPTRAILSRCSRPSSISRSSTAAWWSCWRASLLGYGLYVASNAKLDVFPNFVQPQVVIQTECPGLAPEQVELLVTLPIETMVNGLGDMESLRSESIGGLSIITVVFKEGTDVFRARQMLGGATGGDRRRIARPASRRRA